MHFYPPCECDEHACGFYECAPYELLFAWVYSNLCPSRDGDPWRGGGGGALWDGDDDVAPYDGGGGGDLYRGDDGGDVQGEGGGGGDDHRDRHGDRRDDDDDLLHVLASPMKSSIFCMPP